MKSESPSPVPPRHYHPTNTNEAAQAPFFSTSSGFFSKGIAQLKASPFFSQSPANPFFAPIQREALPLEEEEPIQTVQRQENNTGLPDTLKTGIEHLSGYAMDDVKVHYNSAKPAQVQAHAYAQGTDIHLAAGQEKHLPHEAWHVVQQKQGRVKPTMQLQGKVQVNDDAGLEKEADVMGRKVVGQQLNDKDSQQAGGFLNKTLKQSQSTRATQRKVKITDPLEFNVHDGIPTIGESVLSNPPEYVNADVDGKKFRLKAGQSFISESKGKDYIENPDKISGADVRLLKPMVNEGEPEDVRVVGDGHHKLLFSAYHGKDCEGGTKIGFFTGHPWSGLKWTKDIKEAKK